MKTFIITASQQLDLDMTCTTQSNEADKNGNRYIIARASTGKRLYYLKSTPKGFKEIGDCRVLINYATTL